MRFDRKQQNSVKQLSFNKKKLIKKKSHLPFAAMWRDLEIILSKVTQTGKDKYHMISLICEIKKNDENELIYKT